VNFPITRLFDYAASYISYKRRISQLLNIDTKEIAKLYAELQNSDFMQEIIKKTGIKVSFYDLSMLSVLRAPTIYVICRLTQPEIVIETGVCAGFSSVFILYALKKNNAGHLYSIDLPNQPGQEISNGKPVGWLVPEELKERWELILGASNEKLFPLLTKLGKIDIFYHDSEHSYNNMWFEFNSAWESLKSGGLLLSDDITENKAFADFCRIKNCRRTKLFKLGIIKK
jgi:hypothetical protein